MCILDGPESQSFMIKNCGCLKITEKTTIVSNKFFYHRIDWGGSITFLTGERWRRGRRMVHDALSKSAMPEYHSSQEERIYIFLSRLLDVSSTFETLADEWYL